jgi:hypothetical protein
MAKAVIACISMYNKSNYDEYLRATFHLINFILI